MRGQTGLVLPKRDVSVEDIQAQWQERRRQHKVPSPLEQQRTELQRHYNRHVDQVYPGHDGHRHHHNGRSKSASHPQRRHNYQNPYFEGACQKLQYDQWQHPAVVEEPDMQECRPKQSKEKTSPKGLIHAPPFNVAPNPFLLFNHLEQASMCHQQESKPQTQTQLLQHTLTDTSIKEFQMMKQNSTLRLPIGLPRELLSRSIVPMSKSVVSAFGQLVDLSQNPVALPILKIDMPSNPFEIKVVREPPKALTPEELSKPLKTYELKPVRVDSEEKFLSLPSEIQQAVINTIRGPNTVIPMHMKLQNSQREEGQQINISGSLKQMSEPWDDSIDKRPNNSQHPNIESGTIASLESQKNREMRTGQRNCEPNYEHSAAQKRFLTDFQQQIQDKQMEAFQLDRVNQQPQQLLDRQVQVSQVADPEEYLQQLHYGSTYSKPIQLKCRPVPLISTQYDNSVNPNPKGYRDPQPTVSVALKHQEEIPTTTTTTSTPRAIVAQSSSFYDPDSKKEAKHGIQQDGSPDDENNSRNNNGESTSSDPEHVLTRTLIKSFQLSTFIRRTQFEGNELREADEPVCVNRRVGVYRLLRDPELLEYSNLLSELECERILCLADHVGWTQIEPASTGEGNVVESAREQPNQDGQCSSNSNPCVSLIHEIDDPIIHAIESRLARFLGVASDQIEKLVCYRYKPGDEINSTSKEYSKQRILNIYLNDVMEGGETAFPELNIALSPKRGYGLSWSNLLPSGSIDKRLLNIELPVIHGIKYFVPVVVRNDVQ